MLPVPRDLLTFARDVTWPLFVVGFDVRVTIGENGFPAFDPGDPRPLSWSDYYYEGAQITFQAAMLVRTLAVHHACGVEACSWFTFAKGPTQLVWNGSRYTFTAASDPAASDWGAVSSSGLHNDVHSSRAYTQDPSCWQRTSWFTFRRWAWLLQQGGGAVTAVRKNANGLTVIEITFPAGIAKGPNGAPLHHTWMRAYLLWLDQYADDGNLHWDTDQATLDTYREAEVLFLDEVGTHFEYLSLVPFVNDVRMESSPPPADRNGYPRPNAADATLTWEWTGYNRAVTNVDRRTSPFDYFVLRLQKASPNVAPAPICIFTNATYAEVEAL